MSEPTRGVKGNGDGGDGEDYKFYPGQANSLGRVTTAGGELKVANLFGSPQTMARQLGRQSAQEIQAGALPVFDKYIDGLAAHLLPGPLAGLAKSGLRQWLFERLCRRVDRDYLQLLRAYGQGCDADIEQVVMGQLVWDIWGLAMRAPGQKVGAAALKIRRYSPLLGSASLILPSAAGPLHLRWLDNGAVDRWDRKTSVAFFHPDRGIAYGLVSSVGFLTGPAAGMNAAGLTLSLEPGLAGGIDWRGQVMGAEVHQVLSQAQTIEEAAALLRQSPTLVPWRYVLSEGDTGRSAVLDGTQGTLSMHSGQAWVASATDAAVLGGAPAHLMRWSFRRRQALESVVDGWSAKTEKTGAEALTAMVAGEAYEKYLTAHPLAMISNVGAVLFEPAARRLWVAAGRAPVGRRRFVPLTLDAEQHSAGGLAGQVAPMEPSRPWEQSAAGRGLAQIRHAYARRGARERPERMLIVLEHALALERHRPTYHLLAGLMALRVGRGRRAAGAFERALALIDDKTWSREVELYLAWAQDLMRHRRAAKKLYARVAKDPSTDGAVRRLARRGKRRKFRAGDARELAIDFFLASAI